MALAEILTFGSPVPRPDELVAAVHRGLVVALRVPENDPTVWHRGLDTETSIVAARHGSDAVLVRVTMFQGRTSETIARLHAEVVDQLVAVGVVREAVLLVIAESPPSLWSIGGTSQDSVDVGFDVEI